MTTATWRHLLRAAIAAPVAMSLHLPKGAQAGLHVEWAVGGMGCGGEGMERVWVGRGQVEGRRVGSSMRQDPTSVSPPSYFPQTCGSKMAGVDPRRPIATV